MARWQHVIFNDESRCHIYLVYGRLRARRLCGEGFQQSCQAYRVLAGGGSVHVWGAFHNGAKSPLVLPNRYLTCELYRGILRNALVPFARQHFRDYYHYQNDNATPNHARVVPDFFQEANVTKMEQPARSPDWKPKEYIWDELGHAITSMDNPPQNLGELHQALLDILEEIPVEHLQCLIASMLQCLLSQLEAGILTQHKQNHTYSLFVWPDLP